jgi:putative transposase
MDQWAWENGVQLDFTRPGKSTDNGLCESFNGRLRDECLNVHEFESIKRAREKLDAWRIDYNESRPHGALGNLTPGEYAQSGLKRDPEAPDLQLKTVRRPGGTS